MVSTIDLELLLTLGIEKYSVQQDLLEVFRACEMLAGKTKRRHLEFFSTRLRQKLNELEALLTEKHTIQKNQVHLSLPSFFISLFDSYCS